MRLLLAFLLISCAVRAWGASCTDGVDCYCDTHGDASVIVCEDFEDAGYYDPAASPNWVSNTGAHPCDRGNNSTWAQRNLGTATAGFLWEEGYPVTPTIGCTCDLTGGPYDGCTGILEWCSAGQGDFGASSYGLNCWNENAGGTGRTARIDMMRTDDVDDEVATLSITGGNTSNVFDGNQMFSYRSPAGNTNGIAGARYFGGSFPGTLYTHIGATVAMAYSSNTPPRGTVDSPLQQAWKHEEWYDDEGLLEMALWAGQQNMTEVRPESFPFTSYMSPTGGSNAAGCNTALAGATVRRGVISCDANGYLYIRAATAAEDGAAAGDVYTQSSDFPFGTWGCLRYELTWSGGTLTYTAKYQAPGGAEKTPIDFDISTAFLEHAGYRAFKWNNYMNVNSTADSDETTVTLYRYMDNLHVTNGAPVTCASIGFDGGEPSPTTIAMFLANWAWLAIGIGLLGGLYAVARKGSRSAWGARAFRNLRNASGRTVS